MRNSWRNQEFEGKDMGEVGACLQTPAQPAQSREWPQVQVCDGLFFFFSTSNVCLVEQIAKTF